jgi:putative membrane protein
MVPGDDPMSRPDDRRFPRSVFRTGQEPDARFTLANERTFLAWIRTALALVAGGVALEALGLDLHPGLRLAASLVLIVAGTTAPLIAWAGWVRIERALRRGSPLPSTIVGVALALVVAVVGVLVMLGILLR